MQSTDVEVPQNELCMVDSSFKAKSRSLKYRTFNGKI